MDLIIQPEEVGALARPISQHIDREQLVAYITEVEQLQIRPTLGGVLFSNIKQSPSAFAIILNGGIDEVGEVSGGIRKAMAYYVYARIIREGVTIATRFGAVEKNDEYATRLDQERKNTIHRECVNIADTYMAEVVRYAKAQGWMTTEGTNPTRKMAYVVGEERPKSKVAPIPTVKTEVDIVQGEGILVNDNVVSVDLSKVATNESLAQVALISEGAVKSANEAKGVAEQALTGAGDAMTAVAEALDNASKAVKVANETNTALTAEVSERKNKDSAIDKRIADTEGNISALNKRVTTAEEKVAEMEVTIERNILALEIDNTTGDIITTTGEDSSYTNVMVNSLTGEITMDIEY